MVIGDDFAAEGLAQAAGVLADRARADDADGLAPKLGAHQAVLGLARAAALLHLRHVAQQREHHAQRQLRHGLGGITGGVGNLHAHLLGGGKVHMVHAREGDVDEL